MCKSFKVDCEEPHLFIVHTVDGKTKKYVGHIAKSMNEAVEVTYERFISNQLEEVKGGEMD